MINSKILALLIKIIYVANMNQQPESCAISIIYSTFAYQIRQRYF